MQYKIIKFQISLVISLLFCAPLGKASDEVKSRSFYPTIKMEASELSPKIPSHMWDQIEERFFKKEIKPQAHGDGTETDASKKKILPLENMSFRVELAEKNSGVLKNFGYNIEFNSGGGRLDLKDYVNPKKGSFFFKVLFDDSLSESKVVNVYYISNARKRAIDNRTYGAGCGVYLDISKYFTDSMKNEGILSNTTDLRYVSVLAGTYIFTIADKDNLHVAQLTLNDSRYPVLSCDKIAN
jgi:hypothetical protein